MMLDKYSPEVIEKAKRIKLLVLDVDGVLTDGRIIFGSYGDELKNFDVNDGLGIYLLRRAGIKSVILTARASRVVAKRAKQLKMDKVYQNFHYKSKAIEKMLKRYKLQEENICFAGDDIIDIAALRRVGLAVCPPNAMEEVKGFAHLITQKPGGRGAVREVCELILRSQGLWESVTRAYTE